MTDTVEPIEYMLTTFDNPFNPFTMFDDWLAYDIGKGYNTLSFLARVANVSSELSEPDQASIIQKAIEEIIDENVLGLYRKVTEDTAKNFEVNPSSGE